MIILKENIKEVATRKANEINGFIVDVNISANNSIEVLFDKENGVHIEDCLSISRYIHSEFDRDVEDYSLTVCSPGLTNAFKVREQYFKNKGKEVVIKKNDGKRISAVLRGLLSNDDLILDVRKKVKNTKNYTIQEVVVSLKEVKETKLKINFK
ncbi:MAG: ribosome assembly cofactor RimP [Flavobacteriales bacterium]|nr:ribosome assembly cofactor RimP [Flavobacteriales bacterium]